MPSAEPGREAVFVELRSLEVLCNELEGALMVRDWKRLERAIADSRRIMHALQKVFDEAAPVRDSAFDTEIFRRLRAVEKVRENQMARLSYYRNSIGERLQLIARARAAFRSFGRGERPKSRLGSLDQLT
ncbi:MAG: hypothetical protein ACXWNK_08315 [Vulcanimicrobiaceae bacterium]